jgi:tetrachloro-p-hydroquinone reductive dehalogenase
MLELFHAAPSYYSMVARLALAEAGVAYVSRLMDIHLAKQQLSPAYRKLNPHMTVPTLRGPGLLLTDSAQILIYAA